MIGRGSTPTLTFGVKDLDGNYIDLRNWNVVNFYLSNKDDDLQKGQSTCLVIDKSRMAFNDDNKASFVLTQEETLSLTFPKVYYQVRAKLDDKSIITNIASTLVAKILKGGEI